MDDGPCSVGTKPLAVPNALVHNELNYWAGRYVCAPLGAAICIAYASGGEA